MAVINLLVITVKRQEHSMHFSQVHLQKKHTIPEFPTTSEDTIYSIPFIVDKVNSKLKILQFHELKSQGHF